MVLTTTCLIVYSMIPHKEERFILPIFPFLFLLMSKFILKAIKWSASFGKYLLWLLIISVIYEIVLQAAFI